MCHWTNNPKGRNQKKNQTKIAQRTNDRKTTMLHKGPDLCLEAEDSDSERRIRSIGEKKRERPDVGEIEEWKKELFHLTVKKIRVERRERDMGPGTEGSFW